MISWKEFVIEVTKLIRSNADKREKKENGS